MNNLHNRFLYIKATFFSSAFFDTNLNYIFCIIWNIVLLDQLFQRNVKKHEMACHINITCFPATLNDRSSRVVYHFVCDRCSSTPTCVEKYHDSFNYVTLQRKNKVTFL